MYIKHINPKEIFNSTKYSNNLFQKNKFIVWFYSTESKLERKTYEEN